MGDVSEDGRCIGRWEMYRKMGDVSEDGRRIGRWETYQKMGGNQTMDRKIRTRKINTSVRVLNNAVAASERMKQAYIRTRKNVTQLGNQPNEQSQERDAPVVYAENEVTQKAESAAYKTIHHTRHLDGKTIKSVRRRHTDLQKDTQSEIKKQVRHTHENIKKSIKRSEDSFNKAWQTGHMTKKAAKNTVKTTPKTVKTAEYTSKTTIKTARMTVKTAKEAEKMAEAAAKASVEAARKAAAAARASAKAAAETAKVAAKAVIAAAKAIIAATEELIGVLIAGGWVSVIVIAIICLVGLIAGSVYGIFFSGEDAEDGQSPMQAVMAEINEEFQGKIDEIRGSTTHDEFEFSGVRAQWREVLAVYAVKVTTDPDNPQEVITMDDKKKEVLKEIFWTMNELSYDTEIVTETVTEQMTDEDGNAVTEETEVSRTYLYVTVLGKSAEEMAEEYRFTDEQKELLDGLLSQEYASLWNYALYGMSSGGDGHIVEVAATQIGNVGGEPYWSWYGFSNRVEWCACFVSWCANQCGYIDAGIIPKYSYCPTGANWFKDRGQWQDKSYTPAPGDIIFFDWQGDGVTDHTGIVEKVEGNTVYTIEGNSGNMCRRKSYPVRSSVIYGYGVTIY